MVFTLAALTLVLSACGDPSEAKQHNSAGVELAGQGQLNEALAEFGEAIRLDPQLALAYNKRGFAYDRLGQYQRALEDLNEAIRLIESLTVSGLQ